MWVSYRNSTRICTRLFGLLALLSTSAGFPLVLLSSHQTRYDEVQKWIGSFLTPLSDE